MRKHDPDRDPLDLLVGAPDEELVRGTTRRAH
jgi:hypothetical protein